MASSDRIQQSNYGKNSFLLSNTGHKRITEFELDVSRALFPDSIFDPLGLAGDSASKALQINTDEFTGIVSPAQSKKKTYLGEGGTQGYRGLRIAFDPAQPFSIDEDKVSLAIVAAVIDPDQDGFASGPVTKPIHLTYQETPEVP